MADTATLYRPIPIEAHDLYGLFEHLQAHVGGGPPVSEDVLVEVLTGADAEGEASPQHHRRRRRGLGYDGRMYTHRRTGYARGHE
jgi:hypothetical protein